EPVSAQSMLRHWRSSPRLSYAPLTICRDHDSVGSVAISSRTLPADRLRRIQFDEVRKVLKTFADAADRIEAALGSRAEDNRFVRSGAKVTLGDLRRARNALRGLDMMVE